jgi:hypothetical protein
LSVVVAASFGLAAAHESASGIATLVAVLSWLIVTVMPEGFFILLMCDIIPIGAASFGLAA